MRRSKLNRTVLLLLLLSLTGCATVNSCPPIKEYSQDYRDDLAAEVLLMEAQFPHAIKAISDLIVLREQCSI